MTTCLEKARRGRESSPLSLLIRRNTYASWITTSTIQTNGNHHHFFIQIPILGHVLVHSVDKTHVLVVTVELVWLLFLNTYFFNFVSIPNKSLRFTRFRRSYANHTAVVLTNHSQSYTAFLLDVRCSKWSRSFFWASVYQNNVFSQSPFSRRGNFAMFDHSTALISQFPHFIWKQATLDSYVIIFTLIFLICLKSERFFLNYLYYLEVSLTVLQNCWITAFVNLWLTPLKYQQWKNNNKIGK